MIPPGSGLRILIYALGGGWGHLTRGCSLGRAAAKRGHRVRLLSNSPWAGWIDGARELGASGALAVIPAELSRGACCAEVLRALDAEPWDAVVVDTFPRGLGGELAERLEGPRRARWVWVQRDLNRRYVERFELRRWAQRYDLVLVPGEDEVALDDLPGLCRTQPWLVRDAEELLGRSEARRRLGVADERGLVLVTGCGTPGEAEESGLLAGRLDEQLAPNASVVLASPAGGSAFDHWPLLELLPGVDVLVGAGGYHTVFEARACGVPLLATPRARLYDRQASRLQASERVSAGELPARVSGLLERGGVRQEPGYTNGVHEALRRIEGLAGWVPAGVMPSSGLNPVPSEPGA